MKINPLSLSSIDDERVRNQDNSTPRTSRLSSYSKRHFDFFDIQHSVFSRNSYYDDLHDLHPWVRRPCSPFSGIPMTTLRTRSCSSRLDELSRPKVKRERMIRQGKSNEDCRNQSTSFFALEIFDNVHNYAYSGVTTGALSARCSERVAALARPKKRVNRKIDVDQDHPSGRVVQSHGNIVLINSAWKRK